MGKCFFGKNAFSTLLSPWIVKGLRRGNRSSAFFGAVLRCRAFFVFITKQPEKTPAVTAQDLFRQSKAN